MLTLPSGNIHRYHRRTPNVQVRVRRPCTNLKSTVESDVCTVWACNVCLSSYFLGSHRNTTCPVPWCPRKHNRNVRSVTLIASIKKEASKETVLEGFIALCRGNE